LQRQYLHPAFYAAEHVGSLKDSHAELYSMVERISNLFQGILAIASLNIFLYMIYAAYYWAIGVYDLDPDYSHKRLAVAIETSGWLFFTISNYYLFVRSCELAVFEVSVFGDNKIVAFKFSFIAAPQHKKNFGFYSRQTREQIGQRRGNFILNCIKMCGFILQYSLKAM
jgi:hypothetical protein